MVFMLYNIAKMLISYAFYGFYLLAIIWWWRGDLSLPALGVTLFLAWLASWLVVLLFNFVDRQLMDHFVSQASKDDD